LVLSGLLRSVFSSAIKWFLFITQTFCHHCSIKKIPLLKNIKFIISNLLAEFF
jgi:hypothetical protein